MSETMTETRADAAASVERSISRMYQAAKARMRALAIKFHPDLQPMGYGVLRLVLEREPIRSSDVAASLDMDKGAVSRHISALRDMGLVSTRPDPLDGRATLVASTESARASLDEFRSENSGDYARALADWPTDDIRELGRLLAKFNDSIG